MSSPLCIYPLIECNDNGATQHANAVFFYIFFIKKRCRYLATSTIFLWVKKCNEMLYASQQGYLRYPNINYGVA
jgi:hypothetical protein